MFTGFSATSVQREVDELCRHAEKKLADLSQHSKQTGLR
jgi:hypothetical protein